MPKGFCKGGRGERDAVTEGKGMGDYACGNEDLAGRLTRCLRGREGEGGLGDELTVYHLRGGMDMLNTNMRGGWGDLRVLLA